jgi:hypothetical protein
MADLVRIHPSGLSFFWWDDALASALNKGRSTGRKQRVRRGPLGRWFVVEVGA